MKSVLLAVVGLVGLAWTPGAASAASELSTGDSAIVVGTEGRGLRVRGGPGMSHRIATTLNEGTTVKIVAGPTSDGDDDWYQLSTGATTGWGVGRYLASAAATSASGGNGEPRVFLAKMTAYADGVGGVPKNAKTASGTPTRWGVVAVDPKIVPLGSTLTIEGYEGVFVAEDTGGGIKGPAIDLWLPNSGEARTYGTQYRRVTIVREGPRR